MRYLDVGGIGPVSRIGLGTWQFGSREWGYGENYASGTARDIVQRARTLGVTVSNERPTGAEPGSLNNYSMQANAFTS